MKNFLLLFAILSLIDDNALTGSEDEPTTIERIELKVDGLACPFCSKGLELRLQKVELVTDVAINLKKGLAEIGFRQRNPPDFLSLWNAVVKAGFTPSKLRIVVIGKIHGEPEDLQILIAYPNRSLEIPLKRKVALIENLDMSLIFKATVSANLECSPRFTLESIVPFKNATNN